MFKSLSWPALKAMRIQCRFPDVEQLFRTISESKCAPTLKRLILSLASKKLEYEREVVVTSKLELPLLESFKMDVPYGMMNGVDNVDFLLPGCPSLVNLELSMRVPLQPLLSTEKTERISVIQFVKYANTKELVESNIWTLLPKLKRVQIVWKRINPNFLGNVANLEYILKMRRRKSMNLLDVNIKLSNKTKSTTLVNYNFK